MKRWTMLAGLAGAATSGIAAYGMGRHNVDKAGVGGLLATPDSMRSAESVKSGSSYIPIMLSRHAIATDRHLTPMARAMAMSAIDEAAEGQTGGFITTGDVMRGAVGAGVGFYVGRGLGRALQKVLGIPSSAVTGLATVYGAGKMTGWIN
jgi:hypothetical protein